MATTRAIYEAVAIVMIVSGMAKLADPAPFASTWLAIWGRPPRGMSRVVGALEVILGVSAIVGSALVPDAGAAVATLVAVSYLAFAVVVLAAVRSGVSSCGCFGRRAAPPGLVHVVTNVVSAVVATVVAVGAVLDVAGAESGMWSAVRDHGFTGVVQSVLVVTLAWIVIVIDTDGASVAHEVSRARLRRAAR